MLNYAPMPTLMMHLSRLTRQGDLLNDEDASSYHRLIGHLIYLRNTRLEITFSINSLSQFVLSPTTLYQQAANHILRYIKTTPDYGFFLQISKVNQLKLYINSHWATCLDSKISIIGYLVYYNG